MRFVLFFLCAICLMGCRNATTLSDRDNAVVFGHVKPTAVIFEEEKQDTLIFVRKINKVHEFYLGLITGVVSLHDKVYLIDNSEGKIHVMSRNGSEYLFTVGTGEGRGPGNLNSPDGIFMDEEQLVVSQAKGSFQFSYFDESGDFIKSITKSSELYNSSFDKSLVTRGEYFFRSLGTAVEGRKVVRKRRSEPDRPDRESTLLVDTRDFGFSGDTSEIAYIHSFIFMSPYSDILRTVSGSFPIVVDYSKDGVIQQAYDLRTIPALTNYQSQLDMIFAKAQEATGAGRVNEGALNLATTYYNGIAFDKNNVMYYPIYEISDMDAVLDNIENPDTDLVTYYIVSVDIERKKYKKYYINKNVVPMNVIDGYLWSFDPAASAVEIYKIP